MSTSEAVFNSATDTVNDLADRNVDSTESDVRLMARLVDFKY